MKTKADKSSYFNRAGAACGNLHRVWAARGLLAPLLIGIAVILFSTAGIARVMGWGSNSTEDSSDILALDQTAPVPTASEARARPRCPECGVIVSTSNYQIFVRMADGSSRVIDDANPARWQTGERLIVIAGTDPSPQ